MWSRDRADRDHAEHGRVDLCALSCPDRSNARTPMIEQSAVPFVDPLARRVLMQRVLMQRMTKGT